MVKNQTCSITKQCQYCITCRRSIAIKDDQSAKYKYKLNNKAKYKLI